MKKLVLYTESSSLKEAAILASEKYAYASVNSLKLINSFKQDDSIILIHCLNIEQEQKYIETLISKQYDVILCSDLPTSKEAITWFKKGIKGYLNSHANPKRIKQAIGTVATGNIWLGKSIMQAMIESTYRPPLENEGWKRLITKKETITLEHLLSGKTNKEIANQMYISERTVKSHVSNLFKKFNAKDRLALVLHIQNWQE